MWRVMGISIFTFLGIIISSVLNMDSTEFSPGSDKQDPPFYQSDSVWVDSVFNSMDTDERIGQLFMVAAYSNKNTSHEEYIKMLIEDYHIGGLIFMQGGPVRQALMQNRLQEIFKVKMAYCNGMEKWPLFNAIRIVLVNYPPSNEGWGQIHQ